MGVGLWVRVGYKKNIYNYYRTYLYIVSILQMTQSYWGWLGYSRVPNKQES